ncbi:hypothetical protein LY76DRAFT_25908 [Colletotrichum caudatum]|nr:hypothetical protein LY76DRAFT_25908 [Colletotrichum caudatum]
MSHAASRGARYISPGPPSAASGGTVPCVPPSILAFLPHTGSSHVKSLGCISRHLFLGPQEREPHFLFLLGHIAYSPAARRRQTPVDHSKCLFLVHLSCSSHPSPSPSPSFHHHSLISHVVATRACMHECMHHHHQHHRWAGRLWHGWAIIQSIHFVRTASTSTETSSFACVPPAPALRLVQPPHPQGSCQPSPPAVAKHWTDKMAIFPTLRRALRSLAVSPCRRTPPALSGARPALPSAHASECLLRTEYLVQMTYRRIGWTSLGEPLLCSPETHP